MSVHNRCRCFDFSIFTLKVYGLMALSFCIGTIVGLFLPIAAVATAETILLLFMAYLCLFRW